MAESNPSYSVTGIRRFRKLLIATMISTYLLIVIGGIVRVTGSGLGCPDWPTCYGKWIPPLRADAIIEYIHRLVATITSPLILASAVIGWWRYRKVKLVSASLVWVVVLLGIQGLLGGVVVLLETPPDLVAVHMGNALLILGLIILAGVVVANMDAEGGGEPRLRFEGEFPKLVLWTLVIIFVVLVTGAFVAGSGSTYACSGWPLCNGRLIPIHSLGWIHMFHRLMVAVASIFIIRFFIKAKDQRASIPGVYSGGVWVLSLFLAQAAVGGLKTSLQFPVWLLGLHVALAAAVWFAVVVVAANVGLSDQRV